MMFTNIYENRVYGHSQITNIIKTTSRIIDVQKNFGLLLKSVDKSYRELIFPIALSREEVVVAQVSGMILSFILSGVLVWSSPILGAILFLTALFAFIAPGIVLRNIREKQALLVTMEIPVFLETFQIYLRHSGNTYRSFNAAINSVRILSPYLSTISSNWGMDTDKYIDILHKEIKVAHIETLCRILKNLVNKNPQEAIAHFQFHSNRINHYIEQLEQERLNAGPSKGGILVILPYFASILLIIIPLLKQTMSLL